MRPIEHSKSTCVVKIGNSNFYSLAGLAEIERESILFDRSQEVSS